MNQLWFQNKMLTNPSPVCALGQYPKHVCRKINKNLKDANIHVHLSFLKSLYLVEHIVHIAAVNDLH